MPSTGGAATWPTPAGSENCLPAGTRLADYEIVEVLGEGGFGIVYLAFDHSLHRHVAIKEYMPSALAMRAGDHGVSLRAERHQDTFRLGLKSFINEARFLAQFDHPSLVKVHRYWEQNRTAYTAMQYYDGRTIKDIVLNAPASIDQAWCLRILDDILQALEMLYTMQIVHRDVSPDNIIVQPNGDAVLLDFGSARQVIGDMTKGLTVILKPGYAPVEQYAGDASLEQGAYTDIYALSAVMVFAITGKAPASSIARMIQDPQVPLTVQAPAGYSQDFLAAIDQGMAVLAHDRPQSIDAFRTLLGISAGTTGNTTARATGTTLRIPVAGTRFDRPSQGADGERMPVGAQAAPVAPPAIAATAAAATPPAPAVAPRRHWALPAALALVVLAAGYGLASLLRDAGEDTIMLAHPQPRERAEPAVNPAAPATPAAADVAPAPVDTPAPAPGGGYGAPSSASAGAVVKAPASDSGAVSIDIKPWGTVFVDGRERGVSPPLKRLMLPTGSHQVRVVNPGFADYRVVIEVARNQPAAIEHNFAAGK